MLDDAEKDSVAAITDAEKTSIALASLSESQGSKSPLVKRLLRWGRVEERGIHPVAVHERTEEQFNKIFFIFMSANLNILSFSTGTLGPVAFGLGLRDSCLIILFFHSLCAIAPAYFTTWGPKMGMRQMCISRYTFGYYGAMVPSVLSLMNGFGFSILNCILGGQTLASVSDENLSWTVGIVIIALISLLVSFCGIRFLTWFERLVWMSALVVFTVATGVGGKHLVNPSAEPATASGVLGFIATIAGFTITYSPFSADYTAYFNPRVSSWRVFSYSFLGLIIPIITAQCLGAAVAVAVPTVPEWEAAYAGDNVGGLIAAMLRPVGGFGKFLLVLLSLGVTANISPTIYSICFAFQTFIPWFVRIPRYLFSILSIAIIIPLAIVGQHKFYATLSNFLGIIGYWVGAYVSALLVEHFYFRRGDFVANYDPSAWNNPARLPLGIAALGASILSFALVIPSMDQAWFVGPIGKRAGDLGFEMAMAVTAILYVPLRMAEKRLRGRHLISPRNSLEV